MQKINFETKIKMDNLKFRKIFVCIFLLQISFQLHSIPIIDSLYNNKIKSIQVYKAGWELSLPIIQLNTEEKLEISFDDLSHTVGDYYYKIVHCDFNWIPTELNYTDYSDGFEINKIENRIISSNTVVAYNHYNFQIPNEKLQIKISGNYILTILAANDEVFTRKFYVNEANALIDFHIIRAQLPKYMKRNQQFQLKIKPIIENIVDLKEDIKVIVYKNFDPLSKKILLLNYLENETLVFDDMDSCIFNGGNEFRNFDIKSIKYQSPNIKSMEYVNDTFQINLTNDELRNRKPYFTDKDINGKFFIENSNGISKNQDADYVKVFFQLHSEFLPDGDIYIHGALSDWKLDKNSKMDYNFKTNTYEKLLLVKQGYYNYTYVFKNEEFSIIDESLIEGNHYETENEYQTLIYYRSPTARYDRLIGFKTISASNNGKK